MYEISEKEMEHIIGKIGYPRSKERRIPLEIEKIRAMHKAGFSWAQIAQYFNVSKTTILRRLRKS